MPLYDDLPEPVTFDSTCQVEIKAIPTYAIIAWLERKAAEVQVYQEYSDAITYLNAALVLSHTTPAQAEPTTWYKSASVRISSAITVAKARLRRLADFEPS